MMTGRILNYRIKEYLEDYCCGIAAVNNEVSISVSFAKDDPSDIEIAVCGTLSSLGGEHELDIFSCHSSYRDLVATFHLKRVADLEKITVARLWDLYHLEKAEIFCDVLEEKKILVFKKSGDRTIVTDEAAGDETEVIPVVLRTKESFIEYTLERAQHA